MINLGALIRWPLCLLAFALPLALESGTASAQSARAPDKISVAYCQDCVPFHFSDETGKPAGMIIDLRRLWSQKTGIGIDFRAASWDQTLKMVGDGRADIHAGLFFNAERDKFLDYGAALAKTDTHFFAMKACRRSTR